VRVAILFHAVTAEDSADDQDVLEQVRAVREALQMLGHEPLPIACTLDLAAVRERLLEARPGAVFNLVESLGGSDWLIHLVPSLLDILRLPYTGAKTEAIFLSTQKLLAKERLRSSGLPTPDWIARETSLAQPPVPAADSRGGWILKTVWEHASFAIESQSLVTEAPADWNTFLVRRAGALGRPCFAERFIEGRELNLSLIQDGDSVEVLPPAEIDFSRLPAEGPRIVGYRAKWIADSPEFQGTPRRFDFPDSDRPLLARLGELAAACWKLFGLGGYARVDFRVDAQQRPWILEINANPCLSPDAGFAAALARAGIPYHQAIRRILEAALV
jgi:D-alanine-D-alanine ligase